jgi:hypothetical protein
MDAAWRAERRIWPCRYGRIAPWRRHDGHRGRVRPCRRPGRGLAEGASPTGSNPRAGQGIRPHARGCAPGGERADHQPVSALSTAPPLPSGRRHRSSILPWRKSIASTVAALHDALGDDSTRHEAFEIIRSLIDEIRLVLEGGALKIELRGELAGILALASESTKARGLSTTGLAEQIKMVAGRGFEPLTFRL